MSVTPATIARAPKGWLVPTVVVLLAALLSFPRAVPMVPAAAAVGDAFPRVAFVARADNPVDALAAASIAGMIGAPVFLSYPPELSTDAAGGLIDFGPDLVVLAGGESALSPQVQTDVEALGFEVQRVAGTSRTATAAALAAFAAELGVGRPLVTGGAVAGDASLDGTLAADVLSSTATSGPPLTVASSAMVEGLNAQLLDGMTATELRAGTLASLVCAGGQVAKYDAGAGRWVCGSDLDTDTDTDTLADLACAEGQVAKFDASGAGWSCADDAFGSGGTGDGDTLATLACGDGQVAKWSTTATAWQCDDDIDTDTDTNTDTLADLACTEGQLPRFSGSAWTCGTDADTDTDTLGDLVCAQGQAPVMSSTSTWVCGTFLTMADLDSNGDSKVDVSKLGTAGLACPLGQALIGFFTDGTLSCTAVVLPDPEPARPTVRVILDGKVQPAWTRVRGGQSDAALVSNYITTDTGRQLVIDTGPARVLGPTIRSTVPGLTSSGFALSLPELPTFSSRVDRIEIADLAWPFGEGLQDIDAWTEWSLQGDLPALELTIRAAIAESDPPRTEARVWWERVVLEDRNEARSLTVSVTDNKGNAVLAYTFTGCIPLSWSALELESAEVLGVACVELSAVTLPADDLGLWFEAQLGGAVDPRTVTIEHLDDLRSPVRTFTHLNTLVEAYEFPLLDATSTVAVTHGLVLRAEEQNVS